MKRRTLDLAFGFGGLIFSVVLLIVGLILNNQADFAKSYVQDQLTAQQITFTPAEGLQGEQDDAPCLIDYGGQVLDSGKKAECYANEYIGYHLADSATEAGYEGATYATLGTPQRELRADLQAAKDAGQATEDIQADLDAVTSLRDTMFKGETLRGLLLTTYGFSIFGDRAAAAALVLLVGFVVLLVLSIAGLVHAFGFAKSQQEIIPT